MTLPLVRAAATARYWPLKKGKYSMVELGVDFGGSKPAGVLVTSCADVPIFTTKREKSDHCVCKYSVSNDVWATVDSHLSILNSVSTNSILHRFILNCNQAQGSKVIRNTSNCLENNLHILSVLTNSADVT